MQVDGDELPDGVLQVAIAAAPVTALACSTDGWLAAGTADGEVRLLLLSCTAPHSGAPWNVRLPAELAVGN